MSRQEYDLDQIASLAEGGEWKEALDGLRAFVSLGDRSFAELTASFRLGTEAPEEVEGYRTVRIGLLRNVTVDPWLPSLFAELLRYRLVARFWVGDFDVFEPYVLQPDDLAARELDLVWVFLESAQLAGDARLAPPADLEVRILERLDALVSRLLDGWKGQVVLTTLGPERWDYFTPLSAQSRSSWLNQRRGVNLALVERWGSSPRVHILDLDDAISRFGSERAYDTRMSQMSGTPFSVEFLPALATRFAEIPAALFNAPRKCLVLDLDNTLWGGILGEDGPEGVRIGTSYPGSAFREFQLFAKALSARGVLLAINSKNNEEDAVSFINGSPDMLLRMDDFAAARINWRDKVANLKELAAELNIGLDSMLFVDDSEVECDLVATMLPEVQVERFPAHPLDIFPFIASLRNLERLWVTEDDRKRIASYKANAQRERLRRESTDLSDFIRSLEIRLTITRQDRAQIQRISQLTQKTNQFNVTTRRYRVEDIERFLEDGGVYTMRMEDRFTDYGMIGIALTRWGEEAEAEIDTFLISCRAFGREVESVLLREVLQDLGRRGAKRVSARYIATAKNSMTRDFFPNNGFSVVVDEGDELAFETELGGSSAHPEDARYRIERIGF